MEGRALSRPSLLEGTEAVPPEHLDCSRRSAGDAHASRSEAAARPLGSAFDLQRAEDSHCPGLAERFILAA